MSTHFLFRVTVLAALTYFISGCSSTPTTSTPGSDGAPSAPVDVSQIPDAVPKPEAKSRYGNPDSYKQFGKEYRVMASSSGYREHGVASWYGTKFHGRRTSSGEPYDMYAMTAAHKTLPLPTYARVTNVDNGKSVIVKINDRGPFHDDRVIDLSYAAAHRIDVLQNGTGKVLVETIDPSNSTQLASNVQPAAVASTPKFTEITPNSSPVTAAQPITVASAEPTATNVNQGVYLQVGAFSLQERAHGFAEQIRQVSNTPVNVTPGTSNNQPIYRVQIGPFPDAATATLASNQISTISQQVPMLVMGEIAS